MSRFTRTTVQQAHPVYVAPTLSADPVEVKNCGADCDKPWQSIQRYKAMIDADSRKLADRKAELLNHNAELKQHWEKSRTSAADWDKEYHAQMVRNTEASISNIEESIESISKLIEQEQEILKDRIAQYEDCVKRNCPRAPTPLWRLAERHDPRPRSAVTQGAALLAHQAQTIATSSREIRSLDGTGRGESRMAEQRVKDGFTPMYASVVIDNIEIKPASRALVGVKVMLTVPGRDGKGTVQFDRPLTLDVSATGAMIGFFLTRDAEGWQLLLRTEGGNAPAQEVSVGAIAGLDVPEMTVPPV